MSTNSNKRAVAKVMTQRQRIQYANNEHHSLIVQTRFFSPLQERRAQMTMSSDYAKVMPKEILYKKVGFTFESHIGRHRGLDDLVIRL